MKMNKLTWVAIFVFLLSGCQSKEEVTNPAQPTEKPVKKVEAKKVSDKAAWQFATIKYFNLEGGFYGLITQSGTKYLPMNLEKAFQQDGAKVKFIGKEVKGMITIQQWGKPFKINEMQLIKAGQPKEESEL